MPFLGKTPTKLLDANVNIDGGNIDGTTIGATSAASATVTTFTSTGIDDNATSTKLTVADSAITTGSIDQLIVAHSTDGGGIRIDSTNSTNTGSLRFGDDLDNYIGALEYNHTSNAMSMYVNNATRMAIDSSGNVGIGSATPTFTTGSGLEIQRTSATATLRLEYTGANGYELSAESGQVTYNSVSSLPHVFEIGSTERMRIDSSGNVAIGISSAVARLAVNAGSSPSATYGIANFGASSGVDSYVTVSRGGNDQGGIRILRGSVTDLRIYVNSAESSIINYNGGDTNDGLFFRSGSAATEVMTLSSVGYVGIGTTSPSRLLTLSNSGATLLSLVSTNDDNCQVLFGDSASDTVGKVVYAHSSNSMQFNTSGAERMRIDSSGALFVGATSASSSATGIKIQPNGYGGLSAAVNLVGSSSGSSNSGFSQYSTGAGAYRFYVDYAGTIFATSTSISAISDASLKENVRDLDKGLDTINALQPRRFDWKNGDGNDIMGFIAQEVEEVMPELVHEYKYSDEENKKGLKMGDMVPSMVKAIQELSAQVTELKAEIAALKGA